MSVKVALPEFGESVVEGTVSRWLVAEGDRIERDQPLVEITTDKVDAEVPAPCAGIVEKILVQEGETVPVGTQLAILGAAATRGSGRPWTVADSEAAAPRATPVARRMADAAQIDLERVSGTGPSGTVTKRDLQQHDAAPAGPGPREQIAAALDVPVPEAGPPPRQQVVAALQAESGPNEDERRREERRRPSYFEYPLQPRDRVLPMTPLRRLVAEHMVLSKRVSPHVFTVTEVDMAGVAQLRQAHRESFERAHRFSLSYLPFIVHATVRALREFPRLNSSVLEDSIVEKGDIHIGVAVQTEKGLVVPVVRYADRLSLSGLANAIEDLASRARNKRLSPDELKGGTFTVSNPGRRENLYGFAIINQPQVGILRMGELVKRPVVRTLEGQDVITIRPVLYLALSYDHRAVDGEPANGFLYRVRELLEAAEFDL